MIVEIIVIAIAVAVVVMDDYWDVRFQWASGLKQME